MHLIDTHLSDLYVPKKMFFKFNCSVKYFIFYFSLIFICYTFLKSLSFVEINWLMGFISKS